MQHKCVLRSSIPVGFIYLVLPSLWQIGVFTGGLIVPSQSSYKNLMSLLLCELVTFMVFYRSQTLPVWVLKESFKQGKWAQLIDLVVKRSLLRCRLRCPRLQWKSLVSKRPTPCHPTGPPCVIALCLRLSPPRSQVRWITECSLIPCQWSWLY